MCDAIENLEELRDRTVDQPKKLDENQKTSNEISMVDEDSEENNLKIFADNSVKSNRKKPVINNR